MDHVVQARFGNRARDDRLAQRFAEIVLFVGTERGFLVEAVVRGVHGRMHRAPIRQDETFVAPIALQNLVQQIIVLAGIDIVDTIIGAHHRAGVAALDGDLEGEQVAFAHRGVREVGAHRHAAGFLVVQGEMLDRRDDVEVLGAANGFARHGAGEQRIFAEIFEGAPAARFARQVDAAGKHDVEAFVARLRADHRSARISKAVVPGGGGQQRGR